MRFLCISALLAACGDTSASRSAAPSPEPAAERAAEPAPTPAPAPEPEGDEISKDADISGMSDDERQAFLMALGENVYLTGDGGLACVTCHQKNGQGVAGAFPPLVGQKEWMGDCENHAGLIIHGLKGEIEVDGKKYNGVMVPQGDALNDLQIAAVTSYVRNTWGNDYGYCAPADVAKARTATAN